MLDLLEETDLTPLVIIKAGLLYHKRKNPNPNPFRINSMIFDSLTALCVIILTTIQS